MKTKIGCRVLSLFLLMYSNSFAASFNQPAPDESIIGQIQYQIANNGDNVINVAERYDLGFNALENANPQLDLARGFPAGAKVKLPTTHLLPNQPRQGIIINLPEMRMYYFPQGTNLVYTYPIGIGKIGKTIPITQTSITRKATNPTWTPTESIREFNLEQGIVLPQVMPPGPDNPLGPYAIYMKVPTYLIHSTIFPGSIGKRASFGCIRMYEKDIEEFFPTVDKGIPVAIINNPVKIGWHRGKLFMEAHQPLEEHSNENNASLPGIVQDVASVSESKPMLIDWQLVSFLAKERDGLPHEIGFQIPE